MATESAATPNGIYNGYQAQDHPANTTLSASQSNSTSGPATKPDALEIGWYFVEQYYTTLSKNPERIHLFYSKKSQLVTGKEAEKVMPCVGQKAISDKVKELDYKDCKVRVLNVDSQASFQNIVVQVIGEMSNKAQPHNKFAQTFVLAEQPNGYFVLNDIFRYIDMGDEEDAVEEETAEEIPTDVPDVPAEPSLPVQQPHETVADEAGAKELDEKLEEAEVEEEEAPPAVETNGVDAQEEEEQPVESEAKEEPVSAAPEPEAEVPKDPEPSRAASPPQQEATPAPAPSGPPARKTWASMVGASAAATPALPAKPTASQPAAPKSTSTPAPAQAVSPAPASTSAASAEESTSPSAAQGNGWQTAEKKQNRAQSKSEQVVLAYVKGVTDKVDARVLRNTLEQYGELKYFDVSRPKNCAFVEFANPEGYNAAAAANPHNINGESILVEERRPRPGQFGNAGAGQFGRGGAVASRGRGRPGSQSGGFPKDAGRGGFQARGGNKGNVTPKGRGQAQAA